MKNRPSRTPKSDRERDDCIKRREQLLDEALKETFPASDPPSMITTKQDC